MLSWTVLHDFLELGCHWLCDVPGDIWEICIIFHYFIIFHIYLLFFRCCLLFCWGVLCIGCIVVHITTFYNPFPNLSCSSYIFFLHVITGNDGVFLCQILILSEVIKVETKPQLNKNARAHCIKSSIVIFSVADKFSHWNRPCNLSTGELDNTITPVEIIIIAVVMLDRHLSDSFLRRNWYFNIVFPGYISVNNINKFLQKSYWATEVPLRSLSNINIVTESLCSSSTEQWYTNAWMFLWDHISLLLG